jgi:hypothetical protein
MVETYDGVGIKEYSEYAQGLYQDAWEEVRQQGDRGLKYSPHLAAAGRLLNSLGNSYQVVILLLWHLRCARSTLIGLNGYVGIWGTGHEC